MKSHYPRFIPNPAGPSGSEIKVNDAAQHMAVNKADYEAFQEELKAKENKPDFDRTAGAAAERERCAVIAENFPKAGRIGVMIAAEIRGVATAPAAQPAGFPKLFRSPARKAVKDEQFSVGNPDGTFSQPDRQVENQAEEDAAKQAGFTIEIPAPKE